MIDFARSANSHGRCGDAACMRVLAHVADYAAEDGGGKEGRRRAMG